jgi:hypothetical protein
MPWWINTILLRLKAGLNGWSARSKRQISSSWFAPKPICSGSKAESSQARAEVLCGNPTSSTTCFIQKDGYVGSQKFCHLTGKAASFTA